MKYLDDSPTVKAAFGAHEHMWDIWGCLAEEVGIVLSAVSNMWSMVVLVYQIVYTIAFIALMYVFSAAVIDRYTNGAATAIDSYDDGLVWVWDEWEQEFVLMPDEACVT